VRRAREQDLRRSNHTPTFFACARCRACDLGGAFGLGWRKRGIGRRSGRRGGGGHDGSRDRLSKSGGTCQTERMEGRGDKGGEGDCVVSSK